ncbi:hypothetical protein [Deinococcus koreensis]|uniref:Uncharacterized protein n=1 Tax=Deinococcus koreensis TaxID=2054903 RepID=A0A2K3UYX7_9DEIO|nr:hypothetical protein [Deinococcus koreensis]PNY81732.1 hypothetical protein CVO96_10395 [Deinococcus koreensis]
MTTRGTVRIGLGALLLSVGIAALAIFIAARYASLTAYGLSPGAEAVFVRVERAERMSGQLVTAWVTTVGDRTKTTAPASTTPAPAKATGAAETRSTDPLPADGAVLPASLWRGWSVRPPDSCAAVLNLDETVTGRSAIGPGTLLWLDAGPGRTLQGACHQGSGRSSTPALTTLNVKGGELGRVSVYSGNWPRLAVLLLTLAWLASLCHALIPAGRHRGLSRLIVGKDGRYSNAQFQMAAWFMVFIGAYVSTLVWRVVSGSLQLAVGIGSPEALLALTGIAAGTYAAAAAITANATGQGRLIKPPAAEPELQNLYSDDAGRFDFGDFQSLVVTLVAVVGYLIALSGWQENVFLTSQTTLPDVGNTILTIFGAGQATYLLKKALHTDAIRDLGLELRPAEVTLGQNAARPSALTLDVWHDPLAAVGAAAVTHQPVLASGLLTGAANITLGTPRTVSSMLTQYPVDLDTAGLPPGEYTFEVSAGTPTRTQTVLGRLRVNQAAVPQP